MGLPWGWLVIRVINLWNLPGGEVQMASEDFGRSPSQESVLRTRAARMLLGYVEQDAFCRATILLDS